MKTLIPALIIFFLISCENKRPDPVVHQPAAPVPAALQNEEKRGSILSSKRVMGNLVDELYAELVNNTPELKKLEEEIEAFEERKPDSLESFRAFNGKNERYYGDAEGYTARVKDSLLRERVRGLVVASKTGYENRIAGLTSIVKQVNAKDITLSELQVILKITRTIAVMEQYQKEYIPSSKPLESLLNEIDRLISRTDSLSKK